MASIRRTAIVGYNKDSQVEFDSIDRASIALQRDRRTIAKAIESNRCVNGYF